MAVTLKHSYFPDLVRPVEIFEVRETGASGQTHSMTLDVSALFSTRPDVKALGFRLFGVAKPDLAVSAVVQEDVAVRILQDPAGTPVTLYDVAHLGGSGIVTLPQGLVLPPINIEGLAAAKDLRLDFFHAPTSTGPIYWAAGVLLR